MAQCSPRHMEGRDGREHFPGNLETDSRLKPVALLAADHRDRRIPRVHGRAAQIFFSAVAAELESQSR
jgi:hypothetical protein